MTVRLFIYLLGLVLFSMGANNFIISHLGTDPLDVLLIGLGLWLPLSIGDASVLVSAVFLLVYSLWNRTAPPLMSVVTTVAVGYLIDGWQMLGFVSIWPVVNLLLGVVLCSFASALIIHSNLGIRIMDLLVLTAREKLGWSFTRGKLTIEVGLFTVGWMLGGPFGLGTVCFLLGVSVLVEPCLKLIQRVRLFQT
jgi:uncharacterized membrane protein YczE